MDYWPAAKQMAYHREKMEAAVRAAALKAISDYRAKHSQAGGLKVKSDIHVYRKPPKGYYQSRVQLVETWLTSRTALQETNAQAVARLNIKFSPFIVPSNYLTRPLPKSTLSAIEKALNREGIWLDLRKYNTLSKIRLALRAVIDKKSTVRTYQVSLAFHSDAVIAGETRLATYRHDAGYLRVRVGKQWLRCDVLEELARRGTD